MKEFAGFAPSPRSPTQEPVEPTPGPAPLQEDVDMSGGSSGNEASEHRSAGRGLQGGGCGGGGRELGLQAEPPGARQSPDAFSLMMVKACTTTPRRAAAGK
ncbi:period circadian protein homolog 2-like, partial [Pteropus vampyrus]|uniref:Period circadian protein homolog 2-like n=1 Tax=Pteropus vampyrus TaxID=132908 RepID=A0A6P3S5Y0_PTEVA